jgi:hypothetical protein
VLGIVFNNHNTTAKGRAQYEAKTPSFVKLLHSRNDVFFAYLTHDFVSLCHSGRLKPWPAAGMVKPSVSGRSSPRNGFRNEKDSFSQQEPAYVPYRQFPCLKATL